MQKGVKEEASEDDLSNKRQRVEGKGLEIIKIKLDNNKKSLTFATP